MQSKQHTYLFLFAHQDDELFTLPQILDLTDSGKTVICAYLTSGASPNQTGQAKRRNQESLEVLQSVGVNDANVHFIGGLASIADGMLLKHLDEALEILINTFPRGIESLFIPAWEGGHHDHDACHAIGRTYADECSIDEVIEFALYNAFGRKHPFFNVLKPIPDQNEITRFEKKLTLRCFIAVTSYRSQWKTWLGLTPSMIIHAILRRPILFRAIDRNVGLSKPHKGDLFYERRFRVPYNVVYEAISTSTCSSQLQD